MRSSATSVGQPVETDHRDAKKRVDSLESTAAETGASLGTIASNPAEITDALRDGYRLFRIGADTVAIAETIAARLEAVRDDSIRPAPRVEPTFETSPADGRDRRYRRGPTAMAQSGFAVSNPSTPQRWNSLSRINRRERFERPLPRENTKELLWMQ